MKKDDQSLPKEDSGDLVKFKRLAMRVVAIPKDAIYDLSKETTLPQKKTPTRRKKAKRDRS